jgi:predicted RNA-binding protein with TRAM domain
MVEIPDRLRCLYTVTLEENDGSYVLDVPREELEQRAIESGETYRVALLSRTGAAQAPTRQQRDSDAGSDRERSPPVEPGDVREVTIESLGDQGDGIARIDRGYVVIVPDTRPDDEVSIEIEQARENVAFARVRDDIDADDSAGFDDPLAEETFGEDE